MKRNLFRLACLWLDLEWRDKLICLLSLDIVSDMTHSPWPALVALAGWGSFVTQAFARIYAAVRRDRQIAEYIVRSLREE